MLLLDISNSPAVERVHAHSPPQEFHRGPFVSCQPLNKDAVTSRVTSGIPKESAPTVIAPTAQPPVEQQSPPSPVHKKWYVYVGGVFKNRCRTFMVVCKSTLKGLQF